MPETVADILAAHRAGRTTPEETVARSYARIRAHADPAIFIALREEAQARAEARALADAELPLFGIPVAVKDNIDVAGMATTAACPAFSYRASTDAGSVARLRQPAPSSSARPTSISSRPDSWVCAHPMGRRAICSIQS